MLLYVHIVGIRELSGPQVDQSVSWRIREVSSTLKYNRSFHG